MKEERRGGKREGAGRPKETPAGARQRSVLMTDEELRAVKAFLSKLREGRG